MPSRTGSPADQGASVGRMEGGRLGRTWPRYGLLVLLLAAAFAWTAATGELGLKTFDDCRYARKGLEMMQRGGFMEVTWAGRPDFPYPPLQFWLIGRAMAVFGPGDFAARFPSMVMALGTIVVALFLRFFTALVFRFVNEKMAELRRQKAAAAQQQQAAHGGAESPARQT